MMCSEEDDDACGLGVKGRRHGAKGCIDQLDHPILGDRAIRAQSITAAAIGYRLKKTALLHNKRGWSE